MARTTATRINSAADCFYFDGVNDYIEVGDNDAFSVPTTGEITISFWVKLKDKNFPNSTYSTDGQYVDYLGKGSYSPTAYEWAFRMYDERSPLRRNRLSFYVFNEAAGTGVGSYFQETIIRGEWIHVVGAIDSSKTHIYKNGVLKDSDVYTASITPANTTAPLRFGTTSGNSSSDPCYLYGFLRDVRIWNRKLTDEEVASIYGGADIIDGLVSKWLLNEKSGTTVIDSVSGLNGTIYGATPSDGNYYPARTSATRSAITQARTTV